MQDSPSEMRTPARVLLADDDTDMRTVLSQALRKGGYTVTECRDGVELLSHLASLLLSSRTRPDVLKDVDVIVSDIRMPGVNGLSILEGVRDYEALPPVVLITAFGDDETHAMAQRFGAAAILDKPFDVDELLATLHAIAPP